MQVFRMYTITSLQCHLHAVNSITAILNSVFVYFLWKFLREIPDQCRYRVMQLYWHFNGLVRAKDEIIFSDKIQLNVLTLVPSRQDVRHLVDSSLWRRWQTKSSDSLMWFVCCELSQVNGIRVKSVRMCPGCANLGHTIHSSCSIHTANLKQTESTIFVPSDSNAWIITTSKTRWVNVRAAQNHRRCTSTLFPLFPQTHRTITAISRKAIDWFKRLKGISAYVTLSKNKLGFCKVWKRWMKSFEDKIEW